MERLVHFGSPRLGAAIAFRPGGAERLGRLASAEETGPMTGGKRRGFVQKEELGPAPATHHPAPHALIRAETDDPGLACPAATQQQPGAGVMA